MSNLNFIGNVTGWFWLSRLSRIVMQPISRRRQREILARLERGGHNSREAKRLLATFEEIQDMHVAHRDRLEKALAEISE